MVEKLSSPTHKIPKPQRQKRLSEALRANLLRRKKQATERKADHKNP